MPGINGGSLVDSNDLTQEVHIRLANTATTNYTAVASGTNSYSALPYCPPKGAVITWFGFILDSAAPSGDAKLRLSVTGGYTQGGSGQLGTYTAATPVTGALAAANAATEELNLKNLTRYVLTSGQIHPSPTNTSALNQNLNNNKVPPGGRVSVYFADDQASNAWSGVLVVRFRETVG